MYKSTLNAALSKDALRNLKSGKGKLIQMTRFKTKRKNILKIAKDALTSYFRILITKGITCSRSYCNSKRLQRQFLPFHIAFSDAALIGCAFEYGYVSSRKRSRKPNGGFGIRMLCVSKTKMTGALYKVGRVCGGCSRNCSANVGLCTKSRRGGNGRTTTSAQNTSNQTPAPKLGANPETTDIRGEAPGADGDIISEYINSLRSLLATVRKGVGQTKGASDMHKVLWSDALATQADDALKQDTSEEMSSLRTPILEFSVAGNVTDHKDVMKEVLKHHWEALIPHIKCASGQCTVDAEDTLMELAFANNQKIGCSVKYSKDGGTGPKIMAAAHCIVDPAPAALAQNATWIAEDIKFEMSKSMEEWFDLSNRISELVSGE
ncbi:hypothetical protein Ddc_12659 [Ditylenchus destructor]|nr:hypothetical protein Ddc_12659 [Ditylenchus destructor]